MDTLSSFLDMGGYAAFVWPGYGLSAVILVGIAILSVRSLSVARTTLQRMEDQGTETP